VVIICVVAVAAMVADLAALPARAAAPCAEPAGETVDFFSVTPAPGADGVTRGPAPLSVTLSIRGGVGEFPLGFVSSQFDWGDGSGPIAWVVEPCGDSSASWPAQSHPHTYTSAGMYTVTWHLALAGTVYDVPLGFVVVEATAAPTPAATPPPAATAAPAAPTVAATVAATPVPQGVQSPVATPAPSATPSPGPSPSPSPTATPTVPAPTATASPTAAAPIATDTPQNENRPEVVRALPDLDEISTDPEVAMTNAVKAGATVWVLFTAVLLNQVLQENRSEIERRTAWLTAPVRAARRTFRKVVRRGAPAEGRSGAIASAAVVLAFAGLIYSALDPGAGFNRATLILFLSIVIGVGIVTYVCAGLEALATRRTASVEAAVRPYPATIAIAIGSVAISRLLDFQPGVMYGFVASCAVLGPMTVGHREKGRSALVPVVAGLALTVGAWLAVWPLRAAGDGSWLPSLLESVAVLIFVGGIEGLFFNMIPIAETDGGKIFRWNRIAWAGLTIVATFLVWHVLLGSDRAYFSGLRQTRSQTVVAVFAVYTVLTIALWAYFTFHRAGGERAAAESAE